MAPYAAAVAGAGAVAWAGTIWFARGMGNMPRTMPVDLPTFAGTWTLMMSAMMLPSVALVAGLFARSIAGNRIMRGQSDHAAGVSVHRISRDVVGSGAFRVRLSALIAALAQRQETITQVAVAAALIAAGAYQFSQLKDACLTQCRSPIGQMVYLTGFRGRLRDLHAGLHHGAYCIGCCWGLMLVLVVTGVMNTVIMALVAGAVMLESTCPAHFGPRVQLDWRSPALFSRRSGFRI